MSGKRKSAKTPEGIWKAVTVPEMFDELRPNAQLLSLLTALLDGKGVIEKDGTSHLPRGLFVAERLLQKINSYLQGGASASDLPSDERQWRRINHLWKDGDQLVEWGLLEVGEDDRARYPGPDKRFIFEDAVRQPWCKYKTVSNLEKLLKRVNFPLNGLQNKLQPGLQPYLTKGAYEKAIEADLGRQSDLDRKRKQRQKREIATGNKITKSGTKRTTSGKKKLTPGM
jgi:hypothetical protein